MTRITWKQAEALGIEKPKESKYRNKKREIDGIIFDSQKEADYYCQLKILEKAGEITKIELQPSFLLQPGYKVDGKKVQPIFYRADFRVTYADGRVEVIDVKASHRFKDKVYRLKKKMLLYRYPDITFKEVY